MPVPQQHYLTVTPTPTLCGPTTNLFGALQESPPPLGAANALQEFLAGSSKDKFGSEENVYLLKHEMAFDDMHSLF